jgi:cytochrome c-type biogenesis protein CcmF
VRMDAGLTRDVWVSIAPDGQWIYKVSDGLDQKLAKAPIQQQLRAVGGLAAFYRTNPPAATFRLLVSPLVMWVWIGAIIVVGGGLVAMWPAPDAARRRARAGAAARVAEELGRTKAKTI